MFTRFTTAVLATLFASTALAASPIPGGTRFVVRDVSTEDAYYSSRATIVGLSCTADSAGLENNDGYWGGPATCSDGASYYFYQAVVDVVKSNVLVEPAREVKSFAQVAESATLGSLPEGSRFVVHEVSTEDAYYGSITSGLRCTAGDGMSQGEGGWWSGPALCDDGDKYFFQVSFDLDHSAPAYVAPAPVADARFTGPWLPKKTGVVILDISSEDAFAPLADSLVGQVCTVAAKGGIVATGAAGDGWMGGALKCSGVKIDVYKVAVQTVGY